METEDAMEFITQWPPPIKRPRCHMNAAHEHEGVQLFEEKEMLSPEEVLLAECDSSLSVNPLLAKWWKLKDSSTCARAQIANLSSNPNTLLHYITRWDFPDRNRGGLQLSLPLRLNCASCAIYRIK